MEDKLIETVYKQYKYLKSGDYNIGSINGFGDDLYLIERFNFTFSAVKIDDLNISQKAVLSEKLQVNSEIERYKSIESDINHYNSSKLLVQALETGEVPGIIAYLNN